jgi:sugar phosphate isomerase/epimerase
MKNLKWGITCFFEKRDDFAIVAEIAPQFPLSYLEIRGERPFFSPDDLTEADLLFFKNIIEKSGLKATLHSTFYDINLSTFNSYLREATMQCYRRYLELGSFLGIEVMVVHGGHVHRDAAKNHELVKLARKNLVENLKILGDFGAERNILIGLENSPPNPNQLMVKDWNDHIDILKQVDHPNVGAVLDTAHAHLQGQDIQQYFRHIKDRLVEIHAHNNNGREDLHSAMQTGEINYDEFFKNVDLKIPVIMEIRSMDEAMESLKWIKQFEDG